VAEERQPISTGEASDVSGSIGEARRLARADAARRSKAQARILDPKDVRGDYDADRLLNTTLGGVIREVTAEDLAAFRRNARVLGNRYKGGITARKVINNSTNEDRKRAREQIHTAIPIAANTKKNPGGATDLLEVRFNTNASKLYGATRHFVTVHFMGYREAVDRPDLLTPARAASWLAKENIRFDCDCGRHVFFFRYLSTIGGYNAGRAENGYPRIRNPGLVGVACKHVLRVMAEIEGSGTVKGFLARAIEKGRKSADGAGRIVQKKAEAKRLAEKQANRPKARRVTGDRDFDRARAALVKRARSSKPKPSKAASGGKRIDNLRAREDQDAAAALRALAEQLGMTPEQAAKALMGGN